MNIKTLLFFIAILFVISCESPLPKDVIIQTKITDTEGTLIKETNAGMLLRFTAEEFRELNKNGIFNKGGKIVVDGIQADVKEAKDNYVLLTLPVLYYILPRNLVILLLYQQTRFRLCDGCLIYRPSVSGSVLAGGAPDDETFENPAEMALDAAGNIYVIDQRSKNDVIIRVTPSGTATVFAGGAGEFGRLVGIGVDATRNLLYVSDATSQQIKALNLSTPSTVIMLAGSGTAGNMDGTGVAASFNFGVDGVDPYNAGEEGQGMTIDASGNIIVGEKYTSPGSSQARRITPDGVVTTVAGSRVTVPIDEETGGDESVIVSSSGVTLNGAGELVNSCGDPGPFHGISRLVGSTWTRIAGRHEREGFLEDGIGAGAKFSYPKALDYYNGFYYVADGSNAALRRVSETGQVVTLAGVGHRLTNEQCGGCGPALPTNASYVMPSPFVFDPDAQEIAAGAIHMEPLGGVAVLSGNVIYVSDFGYKCIWKITVH